MTASPDPPPRPEADLLSAALEYADQGIAIMPCAERGKKPALPRTGEAHAVATTDPDQIREWWTRNPNYNIGIACTANRLAVIDIDGEAGTEWIRDNQMPMPKTRTAITARGWHYYYRWPEGVTVKTRQIADKLEIRAAGAYVIAPPSVHPDGHIYQWAPERGDWDDWDALPEPPPEWIALQPGARHLDNGRRQGGNAVALKRLAGLADHLAAKPKGERHNALYTTSRTLGGLVASGHLTSADIHPALFAAADANGLLAEDRERNVTRTITDGITKGIADGPDPDHHERAERIPYTLPPPEDGPALTTEPGKHKVDFLTLKTAKFANAEWLIEPIIPAGRSVALYAAGKTGKSLLALDIVAAAASGRPILGGDPLATPINILYVDQEMTQPDLQERIEGLGYFGPDHEGSLATLAQHLHYWQLYPWQPLDTYAGGQELLAEARKVKAQLVVIDTLIRTVDGEENSADTIKNFSRHTAEPLKAAGIALLRIDHAGKDLARGQRGTSAKRDDVDVVWLLKPAAGNLPGKTMFTLVNEASRVPWVQEDIHITPNKGERLARVVPTQAQLTSADIEVVNYLQDVAGLWGHNVSVRSAREFLNSDQAAADSDSTLTVSTNRLGHIVKWMKRYGDTPPNTEVRGEVHEKPPGEVHGEVRGTEKGYAQVRGGEREGYTSETRVRGERYTTPPH